MDLRHPTPQDVKDKFFIYQDAGVKEYWLVRPDERTNSVFVLNDKGQLNFDGAYINQDNVPVYIFQGDLKIYVSQIFKGIE